MPLLRQALALLGLAACALCQSPTPSPTLTPSTTPSPTPSVTQLGCTGAVTTLAGGGITGGVAGFANGVGTNALFSATAQGVAASVWGVIVADAGNHVLRNVSGAFSGATANAATVRTFAGTPGVSGSADGTLAVAAFNAPAGVALDATGTIVYVADS